MQRVGLLGGTFDPPHIGHLVLAEYALDALQLNTMLFLPAADPPHKDGTRLPVDHRLGMLAAALEGNSRFAISRVDVDRPGPHYTVDTLRILKVADPQITFYFVMGGDSLRDLPRWHHPQDLIELCELIVMGRPGVDITPAMHEAVLPGLSKRVHLIESPMLGFSSTEVVARLRAGRSVRYLVPDAVLAYIQTHDLYRD
jgi:nicotinate-nucleotide adenylyltransferase